MEDEKKIQKTVKGFRSLFKEIFGTSQKEELFDKLFNSGDEEAVRDQINRYFDLELKKQTDPEELNTMRDGMHYLLKRIRECNSTMKILLYMMLFYEDSVNSPKAAKLFNDICFSN